MQPLRTKPLPGQQKAQTSRTRLNANTRSRQTAKLKCATAVTAVSSRCDVAEEDDGGVGGGANSRLQARQRRERPKKEFPPLPKRIRTRLKMLRCTRQVAHRKLLLLKRDRSKNGQLKRARMTPGQWTLGQIRGRVMAGQEDLGLIFEIRAHALNGAPSLAGQTRADRIRGARTPDDLRTVDRISELRDAPNAAGLRRSAISSTKGRRFSFRSQKSR